MVNSKCVDISSTSVCSPFSNHKIDLDKLGHVYGIKDLTVSKWEKIVTLSTSGSAEQSQMWKNWAQCSGYNGEMIQYFRTYVCMTDIFDFSKECNDKPAVNVCSSVCSDYGRAVSSLLTDERYCPIDFGDYDKSVHDDVYERRKSLLNVGDSCDKLFSTETNCHLGVDSDSASCGFAGNHELAADYCEKYPKKVCCNSLNKSYKAKPPIENEKVEAKVDKESETNPSSANNDQGQFDPLKKMRLMWGVTSPYQSAADTNNQGSPSYVGSSQNTTMIIVGSVAGVIVLALGAAFIIRRQMRAQRAATGLKRLKSRSKGQTPLMTTGPAAPAKEDAKITQGTKLVAKFDYTHQNADELDFHKGDVLELIQAHDSNWAECRNLTTATQGVAPLNFLSPLPSDS